MVEDLINKKDKIVVVGIGYVGLPLAYYFAKKGINVIAFDINKNKIEKYKNGIDVTNEIGDDLKNVEIEYTSDPKKIKEGHFVIVAVPTPIKKDRKPDLFPLESSSKLIGENMNKNSVVVYESTVYPGVTEEICMPILEKYSKMKCGIDFKVGYSPERINPGDKVHTLQTIKKIVSGQDEYTTKMISDVYSLIVKAGVHEVSTIKVAEAAKAIENAQRDINIAFMNEIAMIFEKLDINTREVLSACKTKWNFLDFRPGLVGGHCIGVDPYYLTYKADKVGFNSKLILTARELNDNISNFIAQKMMDMLKSKYIEIKNARILILGITFKENVGDLRNTKVIDIIKKLEENGVNVTVSDYVANSIEASEQYGICIENNIGNSKFDGVIIAVAHDEYKSIDNTYLKRIANRSKIPVIDIKSVLNGTEVSKEFDYYEL